MASIFLKLLLAVLISVLTFCLANCRAAQAVPETQPAPLGAPSFPRLMGMNIGAKNYDDPQYQRQLARLDVVILGFYQGWKPQYGMAKVVANLKELSGGKILVGQYTVLSESQDNAKDGAKREIPTKLDEMNWWARKADGSRVQWTPRYSAWEINITSWTRPDSDGRRWPQWMAEYADRTYFRSAPFDICYCDNVFQRPRMSADWNVDGKDDNPKDPLIAAGYRAGHRAEWDRIRQIHPGIRLMGNAEGDLADAEYQGQLEGAFLEGLMGKSWSIEKYAGWAAMMRRYHGVMANTRQPHIVGFNVHGKTSDFRFMRYALASCLMDDGYFCFTDSEKEYSSVAWFDEFDYKLGAATSKPPAAPWKEGVWRRDFQRGIALVNPTDHPVTLTLEPGLSHLTGKQDPINNGAPVSSVTLEPKDGIILAKDAR